MLTLLTILGDDGNSVTLGGPTLLSQVGNFLADKSVFPEERPPSGDGSVNKPYRLSELGHWIWAGRHKRINNQEIGADGFDKHDEGFTYYSIGGRLIARVNADNYMCDFGKSGTHAEKTRVEDMDSKYASLREYNLAGSTLTLKMKDPDNQDSFLKLQDQFGKNQEKKKGFTSDCNQLFESLNEILDKNQGSQYRLTYDEIRKKVRPLVDASKNETPAGLAKKMKRIMSGEEGEPILALLAAVWFISEASPQRSPRSFLSSMILVQFIENAQAYGRDRTKIFTWDNALWHRKIKVDQTDEGITIPKDAKHPMGYPGSQKKAVHDLSQHINPLKFFLHAGLRREITLLIRWLALSLGQDDMPWEVNTLSEKIPETGDKAVRAVEVNVRQLNIDLYIENVVKTMIAEFVGSFLPDISVEAGHSSS